MIIDSVWLVSITVGLTLLIPAMAYVVDNGKLPISIVRSPFIYSLSLGVCASAWGFFGSLGYASTEGFNFMAVYMGVGAMILLSSVVLYPIMRLTRQYNLRSLADILAFRYRSTAIGLISSLIMLISLLWLFLLQLQSLTQSLEILTGIEHTEAYTAGFMLLAALLSIALGASSTAHLEKHDGMIFSIALVSLIKVAGLIALVLLVAFYIFDSPLELQRWFADNEALQQKFYQPINTFSWFSNFWLLFFAMLLMPHFFHMIFNESTTPTNIKSASFWVPMYLLLLCFCVPLLMMAADKLNLADTGVAADYWMVLIAQVSENSTFVGFIFVAAYLTSMSVIVVGLTAISSQLVRFLLPISTTHKSDNLYQDLLFRKRMIILVVSLITLIAYFIVGGSADLSSFAFLSYMLVMALAPSLLGALLWSRGTALGCISSAITGFVLWFLLLFAPTILDWTGLVDLLFQMDMSEKSHWNFVGLCYLVITIGVYGIVSLITPQSEEEEKHAKLCMLDVVGEPYEVEFDIKSEQGIIQALVPYLGEKMARKEYQLATEAVDNLYGLAKANPNKLREQLEQRLSGLVGPARAYQIINEALPYRIVNRSESAKKLFLLESQLGEYEDQLSGFAKQVNTMRHYHRKLLQDLPVAVLAIDDEGNITSWNIAMEVLTSVMSNKAMGQNYNVLPEPWNLWIEQALASNTITKTHEMRDENNKKRWFDAIRTEIEPQDNQVVNNRWLIVFKEVTELYRLQHELAHKERLVSIGHLSAGVAHEIGNPVTGISCLAQELVEELDDPLEKSLVQDILEQTKRIDSILKNLMEFSHKNDQDTVEQQRIELSVLIEQSKTLFLLDKKQHQIHFTLDLIPNLFIQGHQQQWIQVFINLFKNASDAMDTEGQIKIEMQHAGDSVTVHIKDQGTGIDAELISHIFEPFVTSKPVGKGTGLGLSLVHGIIAQHNGKISVQSPAQPEGIGTEFIIECPTQE